MTLPDWKPTRVSTNKDDELGFASYNSARARGEQVHIYLDGVEQRNCTTADSAEGWVERAKLNADGEVYAIGDEIAQEIVHGKVEIKLIRESDPA